MSVIKIGDGELIYLDETDILDDSNAQLANELTISYDDFQDWIEQNPIAYSPDTKDFLAYLGFVEYKKLNQFNPALTLNDLAKFIFEPVH